MRSRGGPKGHELPRTAQGFPNPNSRPKGHGGQVPGQKEPLPFPIAKALANKKATDGLGQGSPASNALGGDFPDKESARGPLGPPFKGPDLPWATKGRRERPATQRDGDEASRRARKAAGHSRALSERFWFDCCNETIQGEFPPFLGMPPPKRRIIAKTLEAQESTRAGPLGPTPPAGRHHGYFTGEDQRLEGFRHGADP
jgi:hypothetical protein